MSEQDKKPVENEDKKPDEKEAEAEKEAEKEAEADEQKKADDVLAEFLKEPENSENKANDELMKKVAKQAGEIDLMKKAIEKLIKTGNFNSDSTTQTAQTVPLTPQTGTLTPQKKDNVIEFEKIEFSD